MNPANPTVTAKSVVDDVFGRALTRELWTANYDKVLPLTVDDFDLTAVLAAVFYMFRFGYRRGTGEFLRVFGGDAKTAKERKRVATIDHIATVLAKTEEFDGFQDNTGPQAILGDLLLCFCLENTKRALGRQEQVQRVAPAHYMASWIDLPEAVANLRFVPEMMVAMLADQKGEHVVQTHDEGGGWFTVGGFEQNVLLSAFHQGVTRQGLVSSDRRTADRFQEETPVGLDQLLMIRLAQSLDGAPAKLRGGDGEKISNQRPMAEQAAEDFSEDIRRFVRSYAGVIPRHAFVELLESCMAVGLLTIITSTIELLFKWSETGEVCKKIEQKPAAFLVDCSNGIDRNLRAVAEQSMDDFMRRVEYFPVVLMALRLLDTARFDPLLRGLGIKTKPYATDWLNLLGDILLDRRKGAGRILDGFDAKAAELANRLGNEYGDAASALKTEAQPNPIWRLAEALTLLQGRKSAQSNVTSLLDSALMTARPNGLAARRTIRRKVAGSSSTKATDVRSLILSDSALDYLVHLHVLRNGKKLGFRPFSLKEFLQVLGNRHGLFVDEAPPGMTISNELLQLNRRVLERRLRDLGLLLGVNDAESMKRLSPRFRPTEEHRNGLD